MCEEITQQRPYSHAGLQQSLEVVHCAAGSEYTAQPVGPSNALHLASHLHVGDTETRCVEPCGEVAGFNDTNPNLRGVSPLG